MPARPKNSTARNVTLWFSYGYLALVCVVAVVTRLEAERRWWTLLLLYFPQAVYLAPALITLPLALRFGARKALVVNCAAVIVVLALLMGFNVPGQVTAAREDPKVRVLAYNIEGGIEGLSGIEEQVRRAKPDVVVFSEARGWGRSTELLSRLEAMLPGWETYRAGEVFLATRWHLVSTESAPALRGAPNTELDRRLAHVEIQAPFGRFHVVGAHLYTAVHGQTILNQRRRLPRYLHKTYDIRSEQAEALLEWTERLDGPVIVAGDFNTPPGGIIYRRLTERWTDSFRERGLGWGYTYPSRFPLLRIDYVFHSPEWLATECRVGERPGSDHRPLFTELALRGGRERSVRR